MKLSQEFYVFPLIFYQQNKCKKLELEVGSILFSTKTTMNILGGVNSGISIKTKDIAAKYLFLLVFFL